MKNKTRMEEKLKKLGLRVGNYAKELDQLDEKEFEMVMDSVEDYPTGDVEVTLQGEPYVVECNEVGNEVDFYIMTLREYESTYGND